MAEEAKARLEAELPGTVVTLVSVDPKAPEPGGKVYKITVNDEVWYDIILKPTPMPLIVFYMIVYGTPFTINKTPDKSFVFPMNMKEHSKFGPPKEDMFAALKAAIQAAA